jgi:hypothetical protein
MSRTRNTENEEKRRLVEEWDRSGQSAGDFGRSRGIRPETLQAWGRAIRGPLRRRSRTRPVPRNLEIVEVGAARHERDGLETLIEVTLTNGHRLELFTGWTPKQIAEFVAQLEATR